MMQSDYQQHQPRYFLSSNLSANSPSPSSSPRASFSKNRLLSSYPDDQSPSSSSPPSSPTLPSFISKDGRPSGTTKKQSRLLLKVLLVMCGLGLLGWLGLRAVYTGGSVSEDGKTTEVETITPPERLPEPAAVVEEEEEEEEEEEGGKEEEEKKPIWDEYVPSEVAVIKLPPDTNRHTNWTVSIPESFDFPLPPKVYQDLCSDIHAVAEEVLETNKNASSSSSASAADDATDTRMRTKRHLHWEFYEQPENFIEPQDAVELGLLPESQTLAIPSATFPGGSEGQAWRDFMVDGQRKTCDSSLIFLLETESATIGRTLMEIWLAYGLAKKEGRAFFIDDTRWPYGNYSTYFAAPPVPDCKPAPRSAYMACPHTARHLIVSRGTVRKTFGHSFNEEFVNPFKQATERQKPIFDLARTGYQALFHLPEDDTEYVRERSKELYEPVRQDGGVSVGVHVRRGDWHPKQHPFEKSLLPLYVYMDAAAEEVSSMFRQQEEDGDEATDDLEPTPVPPSPTPAAKAKTKGGTEDDEAETEAEAEAEATSSIKIILRSEIVRHGNGTSLVTLPSEGSDVTEDKNITRWQDTFHSHASQLILASDDAAVYEDPIFGDAVRAQERAMLVSSKEEKDEIGVEEEYDDNDDDEEEEKENDIIKITGMEGGFSEDAFWALGADANDKDEGVAEEDDDEKDSLLADDDDDDDNNDDKDHHHKYAPSPEAARLREAVGRSYILDLALLGGMSGSKSDSDSDSGSGRETDVDVDADADADTGTKDINGADAIVCAISSVTCRLLAVMMGYEESFGGVWIVNGGEDGNEDGNGNDSSSGDEEEKEKVKEMKVDGRWVNVDKVMPWKGIIW